MDCCASPIARRVRMAAGRNINRWRGMRQLVLLLISPTLLHAAPYTTTERLAYCLGGTEFYENFKSKNAAHLKQLGRPQKQIETFERLAESDRHRAEWLNAELRKLGALTRSGLRADESNFYAAGSRSSMECVRHSFSPCVQSCYRTGKGGRDSDEAANCEQICGLSQACKATIDCREFDVTG